MSMESASSFEQSSVLHVGFYENTSFEQIRKSLRPGDEFLVGTESRSQYSFLITSIESNKPYRPLNATGILLQAPRKALEGKEPLLTRKQEYTFTLGQDHMPLLIFTATEELSPATFQAIPVVTTSATTSYGIRSAN